MDKTGVGRGVIDILKERGLKFTGVVIHGGEKSTRIDGSYHVPKKDLVAALEVPFDTEKLKIAEGLTLWDVLREELQNFRRKMPPVTWTPETKDAVSFADLMEVATIDKLRKKGFSFKQIRKINVTARFYLDTPRPLVTETFKVKGRNIFVDDGFGILVNVGQEAGMQAWDEVLDPFLDTVEYEGEIVRRWWPLGKDHVVVVDPDYGFGLPVIEGVGVRTEIIAERCEAGDSNKEITYDFGVTPDQIEDALLWEKPETAAA